MKCTKGGTHKVNKDKLNKNELSVVLAYSKGYTSPANINLSPILIFPFKTVNNK